MFAVMSAVLRVECQQRQASSWRVMAMRVMDPLHLHLCMLGSLQQLQVTPVPVEDTLGQAAHEQFVQLVRIC